MKNVLTKLLQFQKKVGIIVKDSTNPYFKSKYADINTILDEIRPVLNECGLLIMQPIQCNQLKTIIADSESGETIESTIDLPINQDPQKMGAIYTYYRRFALQSFLLLQAEDDDAESIVRPMSIQQKIQNCKTLQELSKVWSTLTPEQQASFENLKNELKAKLK